MKLCVGDKILVARLGYHPVLVRHTVRVVGCHRGRRAMTCERSWNKDADNCVVYVCAEGVGWVRGHDRHSPEALALLAAMAL